MEYGVVAFRDSRNLGDDIQSFAALKYLPRVDHVIEREALDSFMSESGDYVAAILNGWYMHNHLNWPPTDYILPLPISMHFDTFFPLALASVCQTILYSSMQAPHTLCNMDL